MTTITDPWLVGRLDELAADLGHLRRASRDSGFAWRVDRVCDRVWWLLAAARPTAADLYQEGYDVDAALAAAAQETQRMNTTLGVRRAA